MPQYTVDQWKKLVADYLLEQNASINAAKGAQDPSVTTERIRKDNLRFIQRMIPDFLPTLKD